MKSTPGSVRATPLHGQVVFMPSMRNWFSLVPEPNAEIVVAIPLDGEVGDTPGAALTKSNMLARRVGIASMSSEPKRVPNPGFRASMREPVPSTTTDSSTPASFSVAVLSMVAPAAIKMSCSCKVANPGISISSAYTPGGRTGNRSCPFSFVISVAGPPISAGELRRTVAPWMAAPCSSRTVPMRLPVSP